MKKERIKRIACWAGVITLLLSTIFAANQSVHALTMGEASSNAYSAAEAQAIIKTFKECITKENDKSSPQRYPQGAANASATLFNMDSGGLGHLLTGAIDTGPWLEQRVQGKIDDGQIWCEQGDNAIVGVLLDVLNVSKEQLFCNGDNGAGLLYTNAASKEDGACASLIGNPDYTFFWNADGAMAHLEKLYNQFRANRPDLAPYLPYWSDIDSFSNPIAKYYLYLQDFRTACTDGTTFDTSLGTSVPSNYWPAINVYDEATGQVVAKYFRKSGIEKWDESITGEKGSTSCETLAGLINNYSEAAFDVAEDMAAAAAEAKKKQCNSDLSGRATSIRTQAKQLIDRANNGDTSITQSQIDNANKAINEIASHNGQYWEEDVNGNIVCVTLPTLDGGTISPPSDDKDDSNNSGNQNGEGEFGNAGSAPSMFNVDSCYDAADSLGWILCPLIKGIAGAADGIYSAMIEPFLNIRTSNESIRTAWAAVRNVANIGFAIMFAIVILSQLTGIGLSNYNIKKILPKLIMVAVLVNLSYILCQLAVDLSNILGVQLNDALTTWGGAGGSGSGGSPSVGWSALSTAMTTLFGVGAGVALVTTAPFWIIPFLLSLVSAAISILFFFAILSVREVAVIILIVLAPAAIVCYALPNTKSIFNKWKSAFTSVLLVFPICGALIGGGKFASAILVSDGAENDRGFIFMLMAMLIQVIPFFMIPSLLKKSLAAIGNIGAKISAMGSKAGGFASRQIGHTRKVQDFQENMQRNANRRRDIKLGNKLKAKEDSRVKSYENQLRSKGINLNDTQAIKQELGSDYSEYKKLKKKDVDRRRRLAQVGHRIERMAMEDIESMVASEGELMTPNSQRYERMLTNRQSKQVSAESAALESLYASGKATKIDGQGTLDVTNMRECIEELGRIVERLNKNPEDTDAKARMQALTTVLAKSGEPGENALRSVLLDQVQKNVAAGGDKLTMEENSGLRAMSNFMIDKFGGQFKADDRDTFDLANYLKGSEAYQETVLDKHGNAKPNKKFIGRTFKIEHDNNGEHLATNEFDYGSATKMSEQALAGANDAQLDRIYAAIQSGDLSGQHLQEFMSLADRTLHNDNINLKLGVRSKLERMQMAAYAQNADALQQHQNGDPLQRVRVNQNSADILTKAADSSLDTMIGQIKTTDVSQISEPDKRLAKIDEMRGIAANAKYVLENYSLPTAKAERLQEIISSVQNNASVQAEIGGTLTDFSGNGRTSLTGGRTLTADSQVIKLRDAKPAPQKVQMPSSWMSSPNAPDGYVVNAGNGNFRNLNDAERQWLKDARSYNNRIDFENQSQQNNQNQQSNQNNP